MKRFYIVLSALLILLGLLAYRFPYALKEEGISYRIVYMVIIFALVARGVFAARNEPIKKLMLYLGIWLGALALIIAIYAYKDKLMNSSIASTIVPARAISDDAGNVIIKSREDGHFYIEATVNSSNVYFMVDTGASEIVLSSEDASSLGFYPQEVDYKDKFSTANGTIRAARVILDDVVVGDIRLQNIPAYINEGSMEHSLLGMRFLNQLKGFRIQGNTLTLEP